MPTGCEAIAGNAAANGVAVARAVADLARDPRRGRRPSSPTSRSTCCSPWPTVDRPPRAADRVRLAASARRRGGDRVRHARGRALRAGGVGGRRARAAVIRLAVRVARADAEAVLAELLELAPSGLEEREAGADAVEYVLYGAPGELPDLGAVRAAAGSALVDVSTSEIPDDWSERWKAFHRPSTCPGASAAARAPAVGAARWRRHVHRPRDRPRAGVRHGRAPHDAPLPAAAARAGAGRRARRLGLRTGVLAIAAARLGWDPVLACDWEAASVRGHARERRAQRRAADRGRAARPAPRRGPVGADLVANLIRPLLLEVAAADDPPRPTRLIASRAPARGGRRGRGRVRASRTCARRDRRHGGEWSALLLAR